MVFFQSGTFSYALASRRVVLITSTSARRQLLVATMALFNSVQNFATIALTKRIYSKSTQGALAGDGWHHFTDLTGSHSQRPQCAHVRRVDSSQRNCSSLQRV